MNIAILGTRGIPNNYGGFEQCAEYLSVGLVRRGHNVTVYNPVFHPYKKKIYKGVRIVRKFSPQKFIGVSAANFVYDYLCFKDAVNNDFDIILELGLITSALSIIFCNHEGKKIVTNLDGLEWKRSKWNVFIQKTTKLLEKYGVKYSDFLIADNIGIQSYVRKEYNRKSKLIAYGALDVLPPNPDCLFDYGIKESDYFLSIARLEPENNLELMFDAYVLSNVKTPYYVVGNHLTDYGNFLKEKYQNKGIIFLGGIFNKIDLDNIRFYSTLYLHGHSVGGTNPSLLEAMAAQTLIVSHDNKFNRSVLEENAFYFSNLEDLVNLFNRDLNKKRKKFSSNNLDKIERLYRWPVIVKKYESFFKKILKDSKKP